MTPLIAKIVQDIISQVNSASGQAHARYIGPDVGWNVSAGMTALVMLDPSNPCNVLAQFDDFHAQRDGVDLAFGWHSFESIHFESTDEERSVQ